MASTISMNLENSEKERKRYFRGNMTQLLVGWFQSHLSSCDPFGQNVFRMCSLNLHDKHGIK